MLLGQKVSRLGLSTHKEKVAAICELEPPKNVHDLQVFLGMLVYFSSYIPFYAWIAAPLFNLLRKKCAWEWTSIHQEAFELAKYVLTQAPVRAFAMPGRPYRVYTDACDVGLAGILQQSTTVYIERVIAYWSRVLKSPERNYSPTEREALALKEALIKFQPYIEGEQITAITDHAALQWSRTYQNVNRRLLTW
ncbi:hypothetical protein FISHEDRAFT_46384, partial [Fistulina hepatica ATCC 64428]